MIWLWGMLLRVSVLLLWMIWLWGMLLRVSTIVVDDMAVVDVAVGAVAIRVAASHGWKKGV